MSHFGCEYYDVGVEEALKCLRHQLYMAALCHYYAVPLSDPTHPHTNTHTPEIATQLLRF